ncbi:hypothetical protein [Bosea sp. ASV33]|nr:hypothetical protein [Bosea sp. ASV33]
MSQHRTDWPGRAEYLAEQRRIRRLLWALAVASLALPAAVVLWW